MSQAPEPSLSVQMRNWDRLNRPSSCTHYADGVAGLEDQVRRLQAELTDSRKLEELSIANNHKFSEQLGELRTENARLKGLLQRMRHEDGCPATIRQHLPGYRHDETDTGDPCPMYHYGCGKCNCIKSQVEVTK